MRRCGMCGAVKPLEDFMWRRKDKGWRDNLCRPCRAAYKKQHYAANKERYKDQACRWKQATFDKRSQILMEFFASHPCVDCGESDPIVLEFDHLRDKQFEVGSGIWNRNWQEVLMEMEKCEVVCVNCHRRRTATRLRTQRFLALERVLEARSTK